MASGSAGEKSVRDTLKPECGFYLAHLHGRPNSGAQLAMLLFCDCLVLEVDKERERARGRERERERYIYRERERETCIN